MTSVFILLALCVAQSSAFFSCRKVQYLNEFNIQDFVGEYHVYSYFSEIEQVAPFLFGKCPSQTYTWDGEKLCYTNKQLESDGTTSERTGYANYKNEEEKNGVIKVTFKLLKFISWLKFSLDFKILHHEKDFIIVYCCKLGFESGFMICKEKNPSDELVARMNAALEESCSSHGGPPPSKYNVVDRSECECDQE